MCTDLHIETTPSVSGVQPGARGNILRNSTNTELAPMLTLTKIRRQIESLTCQKQAQSSH
jgi:hypothetical protein